ncbi:MAG: type IV pilus modification protein PilV, partial [Verrucomicrobiota bacterium]|nr:type IV pilus modification protein PilV [Verrucomicrobiota bacterium]
MQSSRKTSFNSTPANFQTGFTLLEVLVSMVILVLGVLGAAAMTVTAIRNSQQSAARSTAVALAYEVGDMIRAYSKPASIAIFVGVSTTAGTGSATAGCYNTAGCSELQLAKNDLFEWSLRVTDGRLPGGNAAICRDSANAVPSTAAAPNCDNKLTSPLVVKVWWTEKNGDGTITAGNGPNVT